MRFVKKLVLLQAVVAVTFALSASLSMAAVTGDCVNCHTMHNSQDGSAVAKIYDGATDSMVESTAQVNLLTSDCLGCHTNASGNATIVAIGTGNKSRVPIVLTGSAPNDTPGVNAGVSNVLAGGNFFWVANGDDNKGHNVFGLRGTTFAVNKDTTLTEAPGNFQVVGDSSICNDCHGTLATENSGCQGCHFAAHHVDDGIDNPLVAEGDGWYRFLSVATMVSVKNPSTNTRNILLAVPGVAGVEDSNWEQNPASHNVYKGAEAFSVGGSGGVSGNSIGMFCTGCHSRFHHSGGADTDGMMNASGAWIRHPSDVKLVSDPGAGTEYEEYTYTSLAPVAYQDISAAGVGTTELVTCISCHRPHGSSFPDMLRWDYGNDCKTGTANAACGCFACHTAKDDI